MQEKGLVPPCEVKSTLYKPRPDRGIVTEYWVIGLTTTGNGWFIHWTLNSGRYSNMDGVPADRIGKQVFLTKEAAKAALKEMSE